MFAANAYQMPASAAMRSAVEVTGRACQVSLIDRRTGRAHRVDGRALVLFTRDPRAAAHELLAGRDARLWEARIEPLEPYEAAP